MATRIVTELVLRDRTKTAFDSFRRSIGGVRGAIAGIAASFGTIKLGQFAAEALKSADEINKLSDRLGLSTEALSEYQQVTALTGVTFREFTQGIQRQGRRISEAAKGTGAARDALRELGLEASTLNQLELDQQFEILADALNNVTNETDRVRLAQKLWDSEGVKLLQTIKGGATQIRAYREEARLAGLTLSQDAADGASRALDAWTRLSAASKALGVTLVSAIGPAVADVVEWIGSFIPDAVESARKAFFFLQAFVADTGNSITNFLGDVSSAVSDVAEFFGADVAAKALQNVADDYRDAGEIFQTVADKNKARLLDLNETRSTGLQAGITDQQVYNAELAKAAGLTKQEQQETEKANSERERSEERRLASITDYVERLQTEVDVLGLSNAELVRYELNKLKASDATIQSAVALQEELEAHEAIAAIEQENAEIFERSSQLQAKAAEDLAGKWESTGNEIGRSFRSAIESGDGFRDTIGQIEQDLIRIAGQKLMEQAFGGLGQTGAGGGGFTGLFGGVLKGLFGFQNGGRINPGRPVLVGERGPELVSAAAGGRVSPTINISVNQGGAAGQAGTAEQLAARIGEQVNRALRRNR